MAGEPSAAAGRSKFLSRSKWGKVFSNDGSYNADLPQKTNFNEDVADFLKPSTDKYPGTGTRLQGAPKINVAIAQRWPGAANVIALKESGHYNQHSMEQRANGRAKRRKDLKVSFVRTPPEIIGEGGDEAEIPAVEVSRMRAKLRRSQSDGRPAARESTSVFNAAASPPNVYTTSRLDGGSRPGLAQRAHTTHGETSPTRQARIVPQPLRPLNTTEEENLPRPSVFSRAPTGFSTQEVIDGGTAPPPLPIPQSPQRISAGSQSTRVPPGSHSPEGSDSPMQANPELTAFLETSTTDPSSVSAIVQHKMRREEGQVFRQASISIMPDPSEQRPSSSASASGRAPPLGASHSNHAAPSQVASDSDEPPTSSHRGHYMAYNPAAHRQDLGQASVSRERSPLRNHRPQPSHSSSFLAQSFATHNRPSSASSHSSRLQQSSSESPHSPHSPQVSQTHQDSRHQAPPSPGNFARPMPSPYMLGSNSNNYPVQQQNSQLSSPPLGSIAHENGSRPSSRASQFREDEVHSAGVAALEDFSARVAHMKGVFRLTADRERPNGQCNFAQWLRASIWWFHKGRASLEALIRHKPRTSDGQPREMLTQAHVDLAKAWWIVTDVLADMHPSPNLAGTNSSTTRDTELVRAHLRALALSMSRNRVLPPHQSLIQGQDTTIWISYPRFTSDIASILSGASSQKLIVEADTQHASPHAFVPLADTMEDFCYSRMFVSASVNTEDVDTDRIMFPCVLSILRPRSDYQTKIAIASQNELVSITIQHASSANKAPAWSDVSWKARSHGIYVRLPRGYTLNVELQEQDFRSLWSMVEYTRKIATSLQPQSHEKLVHEAQLMELQYLDAPSTHAFPTEKVKRCNALVFENTVTQNEGTGTRKLHRGYRLLLVSHPGNKTLSSASHEINQASPLLFEYSDDRAGRETVSMAVHLRENKRQCRATLVFRHPKERQEFHDVLTGGEVGPDETVDAHVRILTVRMEPVTYSGSSMGRDPFQSFRWRDVRVINGDAADSGHDQANTVLSEHLRVIASHSSGGVTDRLNLGPGHLLLRLPRSESPTLQILRSPQVDMAAYIDTKQSQPRFPDDLTDLLRKITSESTVRTYAFKSLPDLHKFQTAITGYDIRFDSNASLFAISRRRMVVPIYKKWEATKVRVQIASQGSVVQVLAFFEDFSHADAMTLRVKSTDVFEKTKGDKGARYCVKLVDAKFSLPKKEKEGDEEQDDEEHATWGKGVRRRFINLEGLEYAEEHDDITIGFEVEEDRDRFCEALPAATTSRGISLMRRI